MYVCVCMFKCVSVCKCVSVRVTPHETMANPFVDFVSRSRSSFGFGSFSCHLSALRLCLTPEMSKEGEKLKVGAGQQNMPKTR